MRFQLGEAIRILELKGRIVSRSSSSALVEFGQAGFLLVSHPVEGDHDAVVVFSLPRSVVSPQSLPEFKRQICLTFDIHPGSRIAIKLCEPVRFGDAPAPQQSNEQDAESSGTPVAEIYRAELVEPQQTLGATPAEHSAAASEYYERFGQTWQPNASFGSSGRETPYPESRQTQFFGDLVERWNRHFETEPEEELYSVPRKYDLSSMFSISMAYALLFSLMRILGSRPSAIFSAGIFFAVVGAAQALMFQGKRPREASLIAGGFAGVVCSIAFAVVEGYGIENAVLAALCGVFWCPIAGYLAGATIGGIWLIADYLRKWSEARRTAKEQIRNREQSNDTDLDSSEPHVLDR